jgi:Na+/proline symporter
MELRYGKIVAYLVLAINLLFVGMFMIGQMKAVGICIEYITGTPYTTGILIGGIILTVYCVLGGMFGITWNQFIQGLIMLIGITVSLALVLRALGVSGWPNPFWGYGDLSPMMETGGFYDLVKEPQYYLSLIIPGLGGAAAAPQVFSIAARAKDAPSSRWALSWMVFFIGLVYACAMAFAFAATYWTGTAGISIGNDQADYVLFMLCEATVPHYIGALVVAGALAAAFSTTAALIVFFGTASVTHVYEPIKKLVKNSRGISDREKTMAMAIAMTIAGMACVFLAWSPPHLLVVPIIWGWELLTCTFLIPCLFACWWKRATKWGTLASILAGAMVILTQGWTGPIFPLPFYGSLIFLPVATIVNIAVSYLTRSDLARTQVDGWHDFADHSEKRYSSNVLPVALGVLSILMLIFGLSGLH